MLATVTHHSHSTVGTSNSALWGQKLGTSTEVGPVEYFELSSDDGRPTGVERPGALLEPWPQEKLQRHAGIGYDVPVPQTGEQLTNVVQFFCCAVAGGCRAGYRSAEDLASRCSSATFVS